MKLLLDTSAFPWFVTGNAELPPAVRETIRSPVNDVWLSVISLWEIIVKHQLGRLPLPEAPAAYIPRQRERHQIASLSLDESAVMHLPKLPALHRDPFDRMLICQAVEHDLTIVTSDRTLCRYPVRSYWAEAKRGSGG